RVALGARRDFDREITFGDGHGNAGHFLQVRDHVVEGGGQRANFVVAVDVDVLVEVAGVADFLGDGDQVLERLGDGLGRADCHKESKADGEDRANDHY